MNSDDWWDNPIEGPASPVLSITHFSILFFPKHLTWQSFNRNARHPQTTFWKFINLLFNLHGHIISTNMQTAINQVHLKLEKVTDVFKGTSVSLSTILYGIIIFLCVLQLRMRELSKILLPMCYMC